MRALYLDIGNSSYKLAAEKNGVWGVEAVIPGDDPEAVITEINGADGVEALYVASVREDYNEQLQDKLNVPVIQYIKNSTIPRHLLDYDTPDTLGIDRFLVCLGAHSETGAAVIVVDAGSACTVDCMDADGIYRGGVIMPGIGLMRDVFKQKLPELPLPDWKVPGKFPGKSTLECVETGMAEGIAVSVIHFLNRHLASCPDARIYITGGDGELLAELLMETMNTEPDPFLLFKGMKVFPELKPE